MILQNLLQKRIQANRFLKMYLYKSDWLKWKPRPAIRKFFVPKFNLQATSYTDLVDLDKGETTDPQILAHVTAVELQISLYQQDTPPVDSKKFPCHVQAVERNVKIITERSKSVTLEQKDRFIFIQSYAKVQANYAYIQDIIAQNNRV